MRYKSLIRLSSIKGYCFLVNEPSLPRFAFICLLEPQNPSVVQGIGTNFATYIALFHPLPPVALYPYVAGMSLEPPT